MITILQNKQMLNITDLKFKISQSDRIAICISIYFDNVKMKIHFLQFKL